MTLLRSGFFFAKSTWTPPVINAAPTIPTVSLNFDFATNVAPVGKNVALTFDVIEGNAAPTITTATMNFDFPVNTGPVGQHQVFIFEIDAPNTAPTGQTQLLEFEVPEGQNPGQGMDPPNIAQDLNQEAQGQDPDGAW